MTANANVNGDCSVDTGVDKNATKKSREAVVTARSDASMYVPIPCVRNLVKSQ
jgi:hypothetical protein